MTFLWLKRHREPVKRKTIKMTSSGDPHFVTDLEKLAAELDGRAFAVTLVTTQGRPHLHITNRQAVQLTERIYCDGKAYWWGWAERIADVADVAVAAAAVNRVLRQAGA